MVICRANRFLQVQTHEQLSQADGSPALRSRDAAGSSPSRRFSVSLRILLGACHMLPQAPSTPLQAPQKMNFVVVVVGFVSCWVSEWKLLAGTQPGAEGVGGRGCCPWKWQVTQPQLVKPRHQSAVLCFSYFSMTAGQCWKVQSSPSVSSHAFCLVPLYMTECRVNQVAKEFDGKALLFSWTCLSDELVEAIGFRVARARGMLPLFLVKRNSRLWFFWSQDTAGI